MYVRFGTISFLQPFKESQFEDNIEEKGKKCRQAEPNFNTISICWMKTCLEVKYTHWTISSMNQ